MADSCPRTVPLGTPVRQAALLESLEGKSPFPLSVIWSLTNRCNLACGHCSVPRGDGKDAIGQAGVVRLLDEMASLGVLMISFTGGEPTLREDLPAIVAAAKARRFSVRLKTNAVLLDGPLAERLADAGLSSVTASVYHMNPAQHDRFVGRIGAFESSWSALKRLKARGLNVSIGFVLMGWNAGSVSAFLDRCDGEGFSHIVDPQITPREDGDPAPKAFQADRRQIRQAFADPRLLDLSRLKGAPRRRGPIRLCSAGKGAAYINHDGELWPCSNLVLPLGDLKRSSFRDIWLGSEARRRIADLTWADLPDCSACGLSGFCMRCMGTALLETGDILAKAKTACAVAEAIAGLCGAQDAV